MTNTLLRLTVAPIAGETITDFRARRGDFTQKLKRASEAAREISPEKLLADLLRRQGKRIVADITECPAPSLAAHLARLDDWRDMVEHCLRHWLRETGESQLSGRQLLYPATLADWLAVADITRREHRAPSFINSRDAALERIEGRLDKLAGLILRDRELTDFLTSDERVGL